MKNRKFPTLFCFISLIVGGVSAHSQTLTEAVRAGVSDSPVVREAMERIQISMAEVDIAKSALMPKVSMQASGGAAYRDRSLDGEQTGNGDTLFSRSGLLTIEQLLFDWGMTKHQIRSAEMRQQFTDLLSESVRLEQGMEITGTFLELLKSRRQLQVLDSQLAYLDSMLEKAGNREGLDGKTQSAIIKGRVATVKGQRVQLGGRVKSLEERFRILTTLDPGALAMPSVPSSLGAYNSPEKNPRYQAARVAIDTAETNVAALERDLKPKLFLNMSGGLGQDVLGITGPDNSYAALAVVRWDLFEGGKKRAAIQKARSEANRDRAAQDSVDRNFRDAYAVAKETAQANWERLAELSQSVVELEGVLGELEAEADSGTPEGKRVSLVNLVQTRSEIARNELEAVDAEISAAIASFQALEAAGVLLEYLNVE